MARFWDERAREHAEYFVDNRLDYRRGDYGPDDPEDFWAKGRRDFDVLLETVGAPAIGERDVVLDIGCGVGRLTRVAAERAAHVHALDVSAEMIDRARANLADRDDVTFHVGDGATLRPLEDDSVDVVVSLVVFQHIPDPEITYGYVREILRVLRPGGWAAFQVSDDPVIHAMDHPGPSLARRILARLRGGLPGGQDDPAWRGSAIERTRLEREIAQAGGRVERLEGAGTQYCLVLVRADAA
jgi:SAM-dependent methyltransferase